MLSHIYRLIVAFVALLGLAFMTVPAAQAATDQNLVWQDMSGQLPVRQNRPVWSLAGTADFVYLTDGQNLTTTGHVWRKDKNGDISDITPTVREAGLERVDRIATVDGMAYLIQNTPGGVAAIKYAALRDGRIDVGNSDDKTLGQKDKPEVLKTGALAKEISDKIITAYNGQVWIILYGKRIFTSTGNDLKDLGRTRDFFTSITVDGQGAFWLGGAVSTLESETPTAPLTAKLVRVTLGEAPTAPDKLQTVRGGTLGMNYWSWLEPNNKFQDNIVDPKFSVGAQSANGLKRIELFANGKLLNACESQNAKTNQTCVAKVSGKDVGYDMDIAFTATITDSKNQVAKVPAQTIRFYDAHVEATGELKNFDATPVMGWNQGEYMVTAQSKNGLSKTQIFLNGQIAKTCDYSAALGKQTCALILQSKDLPANTTPAINAHVIGTNGLDAWTELKHLPLIKPAYTSKEVSAGIWAEYDLDLMANRTMQIRSVAFAKNGLDKMEVFVNNVSRKTCDFGGQTDMQSCDVTTTSQDYSSDGYINLKVVATDLKGKTDTADLQMSYEKITDQTLNAWLTVTPGQTDMSMTEKRTLTAGGTATNGVKKVEIFLNNNVVQACEYYDRTASRACTVDIQGDGPLAALGAMIVNSRVTDLNGKTAWSETQILKVTDALTRPADELNAKMDIQPQGETMLPEDSKTVTATAHAKAGVKRIDIYINQILSQTCNANGVIDQDRTCGLSVSGKMYYPGAWITLATRVTDLQGYMAWSEPKTFKIRDYGTDPLLDIQTGLTTEANARSGKYADVILRASAPQGIERIQMQANGLPIQACFFGRSQGEIQCRATLDLNKNNAGEQINITARIFDVFGNVKDVQKIFQVKTPNTNDLVRSYLE